MFIKFYIPFEKPKITILVLTFPISSLKGLKLKYFIRISCICIMFLFY